MKLKNVWRLIAAIAVCELAGIVGSFFTAPEIPTWYSTLAKPMLNPPDWVFAPVWTILFALMGVAAFLIWSAYAKASDGQAKRTIKIALGVFLGQLVLNSFWSIVFFNWHSLSGAFAVIILLWLAILTTIIYFAKISKATFWLLLPYIVWVSFAAYLNIGLWMLNR